MRPEEEDKRCEAMEVTEAVSPGIRIPLCINSSLLVLIEIFLSRPETFFLNEKKQINDTTQISETFMSTYIDKQVRGEKI